jgi:TetR/AcrR family transcriptional regulator, transcriptional repressor for nem operon
MSKAERTRQYIIEKTASVFNEKGYAGTSLTDLADATGLTKGSIYGNFENKDEVALAAFEYNFSRITEYLREKIYNRHSATDRLKVYPEEYRNFLSLNFLRAGCPLLNTAVEADDTHPALREKARQALQFWRKSVEKIVQQGIDSGEINPKTDVQEFVTMLTCLIEGAVMQAKLTGRNQELHIAMNFLEKQINALKQ